MTDNPHYVTPEEAQTKWCPVQNPPQACVGKECMAWQWHRIKYDNEKDPETNSWKTIFSTTHGYCGMVRS